MSSNNFTSTTAEPPTPTKVPWWTMGGCFDPWNDTKNELNYKHITLTLVYILLSFASFRLMQYLVRWYLFGKCTFPTFSFFEFTRRFRRRHTRRQPPSSQSLKLIPPNKKWRISNEAVSLIHSVVSGLWALYAIMIHNELITLASTYDESGKRTVPGMRWYCTPMAQNLVFLSFGYLAHDFVDLVINERSVRIIELLFHHVVVITAFCFTLGTRQFLGVVVLGLLMELNSIFLHSRSLLNLYRQPKDSNSFRFVSLLNIITFLVFRMAVSAYLFYWMVWSIFFANNDDQVGWGYVPIIFLVIVSLCTTNSVLLYRVMAADGLLGKQRQRPASTAKSEDELDEEDEVLDEGSDVEAANNGYTVCPGPPAPSSTRQRTESTQTGSDGTVITIDAPSTAPTSQSTQSSDPIVSIVSKPSTQGRSNNSTGGGGAATPQAQA